MINWKTSFAGISAILTSIAALLHAIQTHDYINLAAIIGGLSAGIGLLFAKDKNVTGGTTIQPTSQEVAVEKAVETKVAVVSQERLTDIKLNTGLTTGLK